MQHIEDIKKYSHELSARQQVLAKEYRASEWSPQNASRKNNLQREHRSNRLRIYSMNIFLNSYSNP